MAEWFDGFKRWFWNEEVWLPPNFYWANFTNTHIADYPRFDDLYYYPIPLAIVFLVIRLVLDRFVFSPLGQSCGLKASRPKLATYQPVLERAFKKSARLGHREAGALAKQLDWNDRQVQRWFRQKRTQMRPSTLVKFTESCWRLTFYVSASIMGLYVLWDKPFLWDIKHCWYSYPHQSLTNGIWWYYMVELSFYWSLLFSILMDVRRKDFWQMFMHHIVTMLLMCFSWASNLLRVGCLVLVLHDVVDPFIESAKMAKYLEKDRLCHTLFVFFTLVWFITRLGIFPAKILFSTMYEAPRILPMFPAYYIFNSLLCMLFVMHIIWSYMIVRITYISIAAGRIEKDVRSSDSEEPSSELDESENHTKGVNGSGTNGRVKALSVTINGTKDHLVKREQKNKTHYANGVAS